MINITRRSGLFQLVLLSLALDGCAAAVDDEGSFAPSAEATGATSEALKGADAAKPDAELDADAAGCEAASDKDQTAQYAELMSIIETTNLSAAPSGNSCTAACKCCKRNNRFCCSHCNWCSGPIKATGSVLAR